MKLSLFTTREAQAEYFKDMADAIEQHGLRQAIEEYKDARDRGCGRTAYLTINNIPEEKWEEEWEHHLLYLWSRVSYLKRKVAKLRKQAQA